MKNFIKLISHPLVVAVVTLFMIAFGALAINMINPEYFKDAKHFNELLEWLIGGPVAAWCLTWLFNRN